MGFQVQKYGWKKAKMMAEKYRLNWERENQRLLGFFKDIRREHGGDDDELDKEEFQIVDNLEELDDAVIKRKRDDYEKLMGNVDDPEKMARLKAEVKMENEVEFELKALNLKDVNFGSKNKPINPYEDITGDGTEFQDEEEKKGRRVRPPIRKQQKEIKVSNSKVAVSSTLDHGVVKREFDSAVHSNVMTMNWSKIELIEVKAEIKEVFDKDDELGEFNMDDDNIDRED